MAMPGISGKLSFCYIRSKTCSVRANFEYLHFGSGHVYVRSGSAPNALYSKPWQQVNTTNRTYTSFVTPSGPSLDPACKQEQSSTDGHAKNHYRHAPLSLSRPSSSSSPMSSLPHLQPSQTSSESVSIALEYRVLLSSPLPSSPS